MSGAAILRRALLATALLAAAPGAGHAQPADPTVVFDGSLGQGGPADTQPFGAGGFDYRIEAARGRTFGANLFHSFARFDIETGDAATFLGPAAIDNVIARVTGGTASQINGLLRSEVPDANVFLLNPSGVLFGAGAEIDVMGTLYASSADALVFDDGSVFPTSPSQGASSLSWAQPAAFGFSGPTAARVAIEDASGVVKRISDTSGLALVGGNVGIRGDGSGILTVDMPGGDLQLASVRGPAEVPVDVASWDLSEVDPATLAPVRIAGEASVTVGADVGGRIVIRGGELVVAEESSLSTSRTIGGAETAIDVAVSGRASVTGGSRITSGAQFGPADGGELRVSADEVVVRDGSLVESVTFGIAGPGRGGDVAIQARRIAVVEGGQIAATSGFGPSLGARDGGDVRLEAEVIEIDTGGGITTENFDPNGAGRAGDIELAGGRDGLDLRPAELVRVAGAGSLVRAADAGSIVVGARAIAVEEGGGITTQSFDAPSGAGSIELAGGSERGLTQRAESVAITGVAPGEGANVSFVSAVAGVGPGGAIRVSSGEVEVSGGGQLSASTQGAGDAGSVEIDASQVRVEGTDPGGNPSGIFAQATSGASGSAGSVAIRAGKNVQIFDGGQISVSVQSSAGRDTGSVEIDTGNLRIENADDAIRAESLSLVSNAGDIRIRADESVRIRNGSISTESEFTSGGNILVKASGLISLLRTGEGSGEASVSARVAGTPDTSGGSVELVAANVGVNRSGVVANAELDGAGGDISIVSQAFFVSGGDLTEVSPGVFVSGGGGPDASTFDVSGAQGFGSFEVRDPTDAVIGDLASLPSDFLDVSKLLVDECAAREDPVGSLVVRGRDRAPAPPDERLRILDLETL